MQRGPCATFAYPQAFRTRLVSAIQDARKLSDRRARPGCLADVERELTERHAAAVNDFLAGERYRCVERRGDRLPRARPCCIAPQNGSLYSSGDGAKLAELTGIDVIHDLRAADCAGGGQGAPLVPVYHRALVAKLPQRPVAVVNIGGVANVTYIGGDGQLLAFDTGPGNALIDDWMVKHAGAPRDDDGATAARGKVKDDVARFLPEPFVLRPAPAEVARPQRLLLRSRRWPVDRGWPQLR